jgi:hypothetical protein
MAETNRDPREKTNVMQHPKRREIPAKGSINGAPLSMPRRSRKAPGGCIPGRWIIFVTGDPRRGHFQQFFADCRCTDPARTKAASVAIRPVP